MARVGIGSEKKNGEKPQCPDSKFHLALWPNVELMAKAKDLDLE